MFASYFFSAGRITRNTVLTALVSVVMSSPVLAETVEEGTTSEPRTVTKTTPATDHPITHKTGRVARAVFTTAIVDREPVDALETLSADIGRVFFFTDLRELDEQIVTHRWEYDGQTMAEVTFKVGSGARWRVYSSKNLLPEWTGTWTAIVSNEGGEILHTSTFDYMEAMSAME